jgi:uncharacterized protein
VIRIVFLIASLPICVVGYGQSVKKPENHNYYLEQLGTAKDIQYNTFLRQYNLYLLKNPSDLSLHIEKCRFIEKAYYDSYEEYNPNYEDAQACADSLALLFPDQPEALLFKADYLYGDQLRTYLEELHKEVETNSNWSGHEWDLFERLANAYNEVETNKSEAARFAELAMQFNDTLDLTLLLGRLYKDQNNAAKAIEITGSSLDSTDDSWALNQKGKLLLELGAPYKAIEAFSLAKKDSSTWQDLGSLAQAMIDHGLIAEAREYLVKDVATSTWKQELPLRRLFLYDLDYGLIDSASVSYRKFTDLNYWSDPIGLYRIRLFANAPLLRWTMNDCLRIGFLLLLLMVLLIIPYMWILPIHYIGAYYKSKGMELPANEFRWGLRHFWIVCGVWLIVDVLVLAITDYPSFSGYFDESLAEETKLATSKINAKQTLDFFSCILVLTIFVLRLSDWKLLWGKVWNKGQAIWTGVGIALLLRFGSGIYALILKAFDVSLTDDSLTIPLSINESIISINQFYHPLIGFLFVVILVPIYEEILFRGVFLSACEKHMKFVVANSLQALVFALVHQQWKLIPFYLVFGLVTGYYRNKTQSLAVGISIHMTNNLIAFLSILAISPK